MIDARTPVMVVTGFLGSGKTTLVNRLLSQPALADSFVVVNEFGEIAVDHHLLENAKENAVALPNGCLCCRLRSDLEETLVGAAMRRRRGEIAGFDRVIVETSGIADPGPVAQTLFADEALARDYRVGRVLTVVDAADAGGRRAAPQIAAAQIAAADLVVFSKPDRATPQGLQAARAEVHAINPGAATVVAEFGEIDPQALADEKSGTGSDYSRFAAAAQHPGSIGSFALEFPAPVPRKSLDQFLGVLVDLRGADLLRVKGAVHLEGGERVLVQGVRHVFDRMRRLPAGSALPSALVFITNNVPKAEVEDLWRAIQKLGARQ